MKKRKINCKEEQENSLKIVPKSSKFNKLFWVQIHAWLDWSGIGLVWNPQLIVTYIYYDPYFLVLGWCAIIELVVLW